MRNPGTHVIRSLVAVVLSVAPAAALATPAARPATVRVYHQGAQPTAAENAFVHVQTPPPPPPSRTHECKRVDIHAFPSDAPSALVATKAACNEPRMAGLQVPAALIAQAEASCRERRAAVQGAQPNVIRLPASTFRGRVKQRWCYLDMRPEVVRTRQQQGARVTTTQTESWHVDCGEEGIWTEHAILAPLEVECRMPLRRNDPAAAHRPE